MKNIIQFFVIDLLDNVFIQLGMQPKLLS